MTRPPPYIEGQLRAIVGVEILIEPDRGEFKLSQNRSTADVDGAIAGLEAEAGLRRRNERCNARRSPAPLRVRSQHSRTRQGFASIAG